MKPKSVSPNNTEVRSALGRRGTAKGHANCKRQPYKKIAVPEFSHDGDVIAYTSPDCTYAVTKELLSKAKSSIRIGIYDFTAEYIRDELVEAMGRGVTVELLLDLEGPKEQRVFDDIIKLGGSALRAPSCMSPSAKYFPVVHQKVIVIDDRWSLVQSGNYSSNSIPVNDPAANWPKFKTGNRDTGVAIDSKPIAKFFSKRLAGDRKLVLDSALAPKAMALLKAIKLPEALYVPKPKKEPAIRFAPKRFKVSGLRIQPVLTPDNYLQVISELLANAKRSVHIEQQYIWSWQPKVQLLVAALKQAKQLNPALEIHIVLGKAFDESDVPKFDKAIDQLTADLGLKRTSDIRFINQAMFTHCHNKMILIDGEVAVTSSQNWSDTAVDTNREAGVVLHHRGICEYFEAIFAHDWDHGVSQPTTKKPKYFSSKAFATGQVIPVDVGDITFV